MDWPRKQSHNETAAAGLAVNSVAPVAVVICGSHRLVVGNVPHAVEEMVLRLLHPIGMTVCRSGVMRPYLPAEGSPHQAMGSNSDMI